MTYSVKETGSKYSVSYKCYILKDSKIVSPFHDIPLFSGDLVNVINEIPRFEIGKFEVSKSEPLNPITQDSKNGKPRFVHNLYPFHGYPFNYGALPQTWEDPQHKDEDTSAFGDNDPIDVVDVGSRWKRTGEVYTAKVLGVLALLDQDEMDWKVIVVDSADEKAKEMNDIEDVRKVYPGLLEDVFRWFRDYKIPDGKGENKFGFNGEFKNASFAKKVIEQGHQSWKKLVSEGYKNISVNSEGFAPAIECLEKASEIPESCKSYSFIK